MGKYERFTWTGLFDANGNKQSVSMAAEFTGKSLGGGVNGAFMGLCFGQIGEVEIRFLSVSSVAQNFLFTTLGIPVCPHTSHPPGD